MSENKRVTIPFLEKVLKPIVDLVRTKADKTDILQSDWNQADKTQNDFIKNKPEGLAYISDIPAVDNTLSVEGAAADAKTVGDAFENLKDKLLPAVPQVKIIMPETVIEAVIDSGSGQPDELLITTPWTVDPSVGTVWTFNYNGVEYDCEWIDPHVVVPDAEIPNGVLFCGNIAAMDINTERGNSDAPFFIQGITNEFGTSEDGYGIVIPIDGSTPYSITLSIIDKNDTTPKHLVTNANGEVVWEDRLAYKYMGEIVNLEPTELLYDEEESLYILTTPWTRELAVGEMYTVSVNGVDYACKAIDYREIVPDAPDGVIILGNTSLLGIDHPDSNPDAPFFVMAYSNVIGAQVGGYGGLLTMEIASDYTLAVRSIGEIVKKIDPELLPGQHKAITLTADSDGNVTSDTDFETAWGMDSAALQAAIVVDAIENIMGRPQVKAAAMAVSKREAAYGGLVSGREIEIRYAVCTSDPQDNMLPITKRILWYDYGGVSKIDAVAGYYPSLPAIKAGVTAGAYLQWDGYQWGYVSIETVKKDLGVDALTDEVTGKKYKLSVVDGKLTMKEVE